MLVEHLSALYSVKLILRGPLPACLIVDVVSGEVARYIWILLRHAIMVVRLPSTLALLTFRSLPAQQCKWNLVAPAVAVKDFVLAPIAKVVVVFLVLFVVADAGDRAGFELHNIGCEGACLVCKDIFDLAQVFMQGHADGLRQLH